jgi:hypothetical protein
VTDVLRVAALVADAWEACDMRYLIGGSLASSFAGEPRSTLGIDMVVELSDASLARFAGRLNPEFYFDLDQARSDLRLGLSFNLIHEPTGLKVDVFPSRSPLARTQMDRRRSIEVCADPSRCLYFYTPEDILLQKLAWFRQGGEVSDRQWRDVVGIVVTQGASLDRSYLREHAEEAGVADLLPRALSS